MRHYKAMLDICDKYDIDKYSLNIANEVEYFFADEGGRYRADFDQLCGKVSAAYLKVDCHISLSSVVESLHRLVMEQHINLDLIDRYMIIANIEN